MNLCKNICKIICIGSIALFFAGCAKRKDKSEMSFDELRSKAFAYLEKKHRNEEAAEYLEKILEQHPDRTDIAQYKLLLAEVYFKMGKYPSSYELYENFNQFFPADARAEYAKYQAVLSKFYQTLRLDCDQTLTNDTVKICQEYLDNPLYQKYTQDISDIQHTCVHKMIDKEVYVFNFYLKKGEYKAAEGRLNHLRQTYLSKNKNLQARLFYLESQLAKKQKNLALVKENLEKLSTQYPESKFTAMTQALLDKQNFWF